jgi:hypothetical protein
MTTIAPDQIPARPFIEWIEQQLDAISRNDTLRLTEVENHVPATRVLADRLGVEVRILYRYRRGLRSGSRNGRKGEFPTDTFPRAAIEDDRLAALPRPRPPGHRQDDLPRAPGAAPPPPSTAASRRRRRQPHPHRRRRDRRPRHRIPDENVGTLHAHCYRALDRPKLAETPEGIRAWNEAHPAPRPHRRRPARGRAPSTLDSGRTRGDELHARS